MKAWLLAVAAVCLFAGTSRAEDNGVGYLLQGWSRIDKAATRLKFRLLGSLIQEGMTVDEVTRILGDRWSNVCAGTVNTQICASSRHGICVVFSQQFTENPRGSVSRVKKVS